MPDVRITIDGKEVSVPAGSTVLEAAESIGIEIPTLCHHPAVEPIGACRMCLVEIEKQRTLQPACTFPVSDGMVVHTHSEKVIKARRFVLQLLFSERNHFCMYCQMSGSCELQDLAYEYGLDHWTYERPFPKLPVDASREYFIMDHNRCILCRRCIRACDELVGNKTLGIKNRGTNSMIIADLDVPFGESSCVSCGTCLQVCPTGALADRASAYMGAEDEIERVKSRCMACSVGCGVELIVRENRVIRIEGDWDAEPNSGLLCEIGRFHPLHEQRQRVYEPLIRGEDGLQKVDWEDALGLAAEKIREADDDLVSVVSGFASTEAAEAVINQLPGQKVTMEGPAPDVQSAPLSTLDEADLFIVIDADLTVNYQVAGFAIKRGFRHRGARLVVIDDEENGLDPWASEKLSLEEAEEVLDRAEDAEHPVVLCDVEGLELAQSLSKEISDSDLVVFAPAGNTLGLKEAGIESAFAESEKASVYYVLADEAPEMGDALSQALSEAEFVIVQASFQEPWDDVADVILPSPITSEKSGTMVNTEGRVEQIVAAVDKSLPDEVEVIEKIGNRIRAASASAGE
ncbi:MAG: 2Fe-2S iron-sulfur cluster-binding protein [Chloroflexota bacterium]|nr:2Fe-2S iron-sulfur cluster-binding protein [Chloroflexota bacterium]